MESLLYIVADTIVSFLLFIYLPLLTLAHVAVALCLVFLPYIIIKWLLQQFQRAGDIAAEKAKHRASRMKWGK